MNIEVKRMTIEDYYKIENILTNEFDSFWSPNLLREELNSNNSIYFVAISNNEIVGFAGIKVIIDSADIMNIVTKKSYRKNGIGSILLENLITYSRSSGVKDLFLEVNENNIPAINLYSKYNFSNIGIRKNYYDCDSCINMKLSL